MCNLAKITASLRKAIYAPKEVAEDFIQDLMVVGFVLKVTGSNFGRLNEDKFRVDNFVIYCSPVIQLFYAVFVGSRWSVVTGLILVGCNVFLVLLRGTRNFCCTNHPELR